MDLRERVARAIAKSGFTRDGEPYVSSWHLMAAEAALAAIEGAEMVIVPDLSSDPVREAGVLQMERAAIMEHWLALTGAARKKDAAAFEDAWLKLGGRIVFTRPDNEGMAWAIAEAQKICGGSP